MLNYVFLWSGSQHISSSICAKLATYLAFSSVKRLFDAKYNSASEAAWRIMGFEIVTNEPTVAR